MGLIFAIMPSRPGDGLIIIILPLAIIGLVMGLKSKNEENSPWAIAGLIVSGILLLMCMPWLL